MEASSLLKDTKEGASAMDVVNLFQVGMVRGKKLYLKMSVDEESWLNLEVCDSLVIDVDLVRWSAAGMFIRS